MVETLSFWFIIFYCKAATVVPGHYCMQPPSPSCGISYFNRTVSYWSKITSIPSLSYPSCFPFCPVCFPWCSYSHCSTTLLHFIQYGSQIHTHQPYTVHPLHLHTARYLPIQQVPQPVDPTVIKNIRGVSVLLEGPPASASQPSSTGNPAQRS